MTQRKALEVLAKRRRWLDQRIRDNPTKDLSYDEAERSALDLVLRKLDDRGESNNGSAPVDSRPMSSPAAPPRRPRR